MMSNFLFLGLALATIAYSQSYAAVLAGSTLMVSRLQRIAVQCGVNHSPLMSRHTTAGPFLAAVRLAGTRLPAPPGKWR